MLHPGSPRHQGGPVGLRKLRQHGTRASQLAIEPAQRLGKLQHKRRIQQVLAGGTPMQITGGFGTQQRGKLLHQRDRQIPRQRRVSAQRLKVDPIDNAACRNRLSRTCGNNAHLRFRARQGCFKTQHRLDTMPVAESLHKGARTKEIVEQGARRGLG